MTLGNFIFFIMELLSYPAIYTVWKWRYHKEEK